MAAWDSAGVSSALTLTGSYGTVQESAADKEWVLTPGELVQLLLDVNFQTTPTEDCDVLIVRSHDGITWETDGEAERHIISVANRETDDPAIRSIDVHSCYAFKVRARVRDTDDTAGGGDTTSTLTCRYRHDGVGT